MVQYATFILRGEHLTAQAREHMGAGDWKAGIELLTDALEGMTYEQAIGVIEGQYKLTGQGSTIMMEPDDPAVAALLQEQYKAEYGMGQYVKRDNWFYEPYLVIDNLGEHDVEPVAALPEYQDSGPRMQEISQRGRWMYSTEMVHHKSCWSNFPRSLLCLRAMHYAQSPTTDFAEVLTNEKGRDVVVLFQRVPAAETPFWRTKDNTSAQRSFSCLEEYLPSGGHAQRYGEVHPSKVERTTVVAAPAQPSAQERDEAREKVEKEQAEERERAAKMVAEVVELTAKIRAYADADTEYGWHDFRWTDKETGKRLVLRAPKRALLCYALSRTSASHRCPEYTAISPESFKTYEDDPYHTDVWLGCGLALDPKTYVHSSPEYRAVLDMMFEVQRDMLNFEVQVLAKGPEIAGTVVYPDHVGIDKTCILVVPHAGVEYEVQALAAGAVVTQAGGRLAHLVTVCREMGKPILRMDDALEKLRPGQYVTVLPAEGKIHILPGRRG